MEIELQTISQIAQDLPDNATIVEVGSLFGRSSVVWALSAPTATVYCIDRYEDWDQCFNFDVDENMLSEIFGQYGNMTKCKLV